MTRSMVSADRVELVEQLLEVYSHIANLHRQTFPAAVRPVARTSRVIDEAAIHKYHREENLKGISIFARSRRGEAVRAAEAAATSAIAEKREEAAAELAAQQAKLDELWRLLNTNDPEVTMASLAAAFEDNDAAAAPLGISDAEASLIVIVPAASSMPAKKPDVTPTGRPTIKAIPKKEAADWHKATVAGYTLATVKEALAVAPGLTSVRIVATAMAEPDAYGRSHPDVLLAARVERSALVGVKWDDADSVRVLNDTASELRVRQVGVTKAFGPLDLSDEPALASLLSAIDFDELTSR